MVKVHTGCVNDVDSVFLLVSRGWHGRFPIAERGSTLDGDTLLPLELHAVHLCAHIIAAANL